MHVDRRLIVNFLYSFIGAIVPAVLLIVTVPLYLKLVGEGRYGVLSLIWLLFGYLGLFDFGLSRATAQRLASLRLASFEKRNSVFVSALMLNFMLGAAIGLIFFVFAGPMASLLTSKNGAFARELADALPYVALLFPFALVSNVFVGRLEAEERFGGLNNVQILGNIAIQTFPLLFVHLWGVNIKVAVLGVIAARALTILLTMMMVGSVQFRPGSFDRDEARHLLSFGVWVSISNVVSPILVSIDQFLIGYLLGNRAVAHYAVPFNVVMRLLIAPTALIRVMFPRMSALSWQEANGLAGKVLPVVSLVMACLCTVTMLFSDIGLRLWVGRDFATEASGVADILLFGVWANGIAFIPYGLLHAQAKARVVAIIHVAEILPFLFILYASVIVFGLKGAAAAWSVRVFVDAVLLFVASGLSPRLLMKTALPILLFLACYMGKLHYQGIL